MHWDLCSRCHLVRYISPSQFMPYLKLMLYLVELFSHSCITIIFCYWRCTMHLFGPDIFDPGRGLLGSKLHSQRNFTSVFETQVAFDQLIWSHKVSQIYLSPYVVLVAMRHQSQWSNCLMKCSGSSFSMPLHPKAAPGLGNLLCARDIAPVHLTTQYRHQEERGLIYLGTLLSNTYGWISAVYFALEDCKGI